MRGPLVAGLAMTLGLSMAVPAVAKEPVVAGGRLEFSLTDLSGAPVSASDPRFSGKVVLVDLWGTWCPPCLSEIPTFIDLQAKYGDRGLVIVGIAFEDEEQAEERRVKLARFVEEHELNYLVLDGGRPERFETALPNVQHVRGFPVEILIDRDGNVTASRNGYGYKKKWAAKLAGEIERLLGSAADGP